MSTGACCVRCGLADQKTLGNMIIAPWRWCGFSKWKTTDHDRTEKYHGCCRPFSCGKKNTEFIMTPDPTNIKNQKEVHVTKAEHLAPLHIWEMLCSNEFINEIYTKRKVEKALKSEIGRFGSPMIEILKRDPKFKSTEIIDWILNTSDIKIIVLTSDGDIFVPTKGIVEAFKDVGAFSKNPKVQKKLEDFYSWETMRTESKLDFNEEDDDFVRVEENGEKDEEVVVKIKENGEKEEKVKENGKTEKKVP